MASNAPYYQMRAGQLPARTNSSNAALQADAPQDGDLDHVPILPEQSTKTVRRPGADSQSNDFEESHNLVELLEAAATAADQGSVAMYSEKSTPAVLDTQSTRKRLSTPTGAATPNEMDEESSVAKRRRIDPSSTDPNLESNIIMHSPTPKASPSPSRDSLLVNARAVGVHSAVALFRRTSSNATRKYTRPPMSKLFMSLNITPENFIALQALAKAYMLSPAHPDRQSCVGNRGKGDTDMVKLRLFNCVRDFLTDGGVGEQFFGEHVEKPGERESSEAAAALGEESGGVEKLVWPRDGNKIVSLVTPLMRRMVTNERQRLYAIDTRKGGKKTENEDSVDGHIHHSSPTPDVEQQFQAVLDPTLQRPTAMQRSPPSTPSTTVVRTDAPSATALSTNSPALAASPKSPLAPLSADAAEPHLTNINIFLTYAPNASKSIKLDEKRISTTRPAHLTFYNYTAFLEQVTSMVNRAELLHPSIKPPSSSVDTAPAGTRETENLRGLAAAANALQPDRDDQQSQPALSASTSARYTVKTVGPTGWQVIDSAEGWYHVLTERAFATWADGVCNIIVELGAGGSLMSVGKVGSSLDGEVQMEDV
ncbi:hypothetical protein C7974DRAFT_234301 [Boeremia exigua]|uniref:uncharacterized protein n=1 Tax=Boeremia exigua TaxID=749465 RepID=UPI001E8D35E6|nr:uncharacterized protein C7974DRAFT_234301 [Boeremia exigua]KAH6620448.1 hypothetical protein C7974DRAFT_234301 [Boeremia exigua]